MLHIIFIHIHTPPFILQKVSKIHTKTTTARSMSNAHKKDQQGWWARYREEGGGVMMRKQKEEYIILSLLPRRKKQKQEREVFFGVNKRPASECSTACNTDRKQIEVAEE